MIATQVAPDVIPDYVLDQAAKSQAFRLASNNTGNRFSLAGVQMKFSMQERDGRYQVAETGALGDWIIKPPSTTHKEVPLNEYTAIRLAELAGVDIPEVRLVPMTQVEQLAPINLPNETYAYAIKRFDRDSGQRIHMEDFAQILAKYPQEKYPQEKYQGGNYQQVARILYEYSEDSLEDSQQLTRRLLVNIPLANGDAHLKNWSVVYPDKRNPRLSPAYDIVTTRVYIPDEHELALNLGKAKKWYQSGMNQFQYWAEKSDNPWRAIKPHLLDVLDKARTLWPEALATLPMAESHKTDLKNHWRQLHSDFRIEAG